MSAPISGPRLTEQIGALVDQYIKAGGRIERLPGTTLKPLPPRRHPKREPLDETAEQILIMTKDGHSLRFIAAHLGHPHTGRVRHIAKRHGIKLRGI